jgi:cell wall-associated NlpC family hydrolase
LIEVAKQRGLLYVDDPTYTMRPTPEQLLACMSKSCDRVDYAQQADILLFFNIGPAWPQHVGIYTDRGMIHSARGLGVVEERLSDDWLSRLHSSWRYKAWPS